MLCVWCVWCVCGVCVVCVVCGVCVWCVFFPLSSLSFLLCVCGFDYLRDRAHALARCRGRAGAAGRVQLRTVSPRLPGLYRSANLEQATAADAAFLLDGAKIRTVIDLRNRMR